MIGRGHTVWFGWQSAGKRKSVPSFATHLVAVTKFGAQKMLASMENGELKKGHWDRVLRGWLVEENYQCPKVMGGSFCWPSVGYYQTHESGCEPGIGERVAHWNNTCVQAGVRPRRAGDRARWLAYWPVPEQGGAVWLEQITFDARKTRGSHRALQTGGGARTTTGSGCCGTGGGFLTTGGLGQRGQQTKKARARAKERAAIQNRALRLRTNGRTSAKSPTSTSGTTKIIATCRSRGSQSSWWWTGTTGTGTPGAQRGNGTRGKKTSPCTRGGSSRSILRNR